MIRILLTAVGGLALLATANAGEPAQKGAAKYKPEAREALTMERVKTREDAAKFGESEFILADADGNGSLSEAEFAKLQTGMKKPEGAMPATPAAGAVSQFPAIAGEDGLISKEELAAARVASFDAADADLNRTLSEAEHQVFTSLIVAPKAEAPNL